MLVYGTIVDMMTLTPPPVGRYDLRTYRLVGFILIILSFFSLLLFPACTSNEEPDILKAAIIDQNYLAVPNDEFVMEATDYLEDFGFLVDLHQGESVTVDLYRDLPKMGYELILFRVHSALRPDQAAKDRATWLFTSESYSLTKYVSEQESFRLAAGILEYTDNREREVFAVGPGYVSKDMRGDFDDTVIIMMGCGPMKYDDMVRALTEKGAAVCLGWDEKARWDYLDNTTLALMRKLLMESLPIDEAVIAVMDEIGPGPALGAELGYYPKESADRSLLEIANLN